MRTSSQGNAARLLIAAVILGAVAVAACTSSSPNTAGDASVGGRNDGSGGKGGEGGEDVTIDTGNHVNDAGGVVDGPTDAGGLVDGPTDAGGKGPVPPAAAAAAGFTKLVFNQGGDAGWDIDRQNNDPGHAWYSDQASGDFFGTGPSTTQLEDGGVLNLASGGMASAVRHGSGHDAGYVGYAFGGGYYVEASLALTPGCGQTGIVSAFWGLPVEKEEAPSNSDQWPGQPAGYVHYVELDFMEFHLPLPASTSYYVLDWRGEFASDTPTCVHTKKPDGSLNDGFCNCGNNGNCGALAPANGADNLPNSTNFAAFNVYGALVVPAEAGTPDSGSSQGFFNGNKTPSSLHWDPYDPTLGPPLRKGQAFAVTDIEHVYLVATAQPCAMRLAYVRVWQRP